MRRRHLHLSTSTLPLYTGIVYPRSWALPERTATISTILHKAHISRYLPPCTEWISSAAPTSTSAAKPLTGCQSPILPDTSRHTRSMKDPVARTSSPYVDPSHKGPISQQLSSNHPTNLRKSSSLPTLRPVYNTRCSRNAAWLTRSSCSACQQRQQDRSPPWWCRVRPTSPIRAAQACF